MSNYLINYEYDRFSKVSFFRGKQNLFFKDYLDFSFKNLGDTEITELLVQRPSSLDDINILYLGVNNITYVGAAIISKYLINDTYLKHISLESNHIGDQGCESLAIMLKNNSYLESLIIGGNNITDIGALHISESLRKNKTLKNLVLVNNNISNISLISFCDTLKVNKTLTRFSLSYYCTNQEGKIVNSIFKDNVSLLDFSMDFQNSEDSYEFIYNLNFNRSINIRRGNFFNITPIFFLHHFLIGFYKPSSFYKILPLEIAFLIANYTGLLCSIFIKEWLETQRQIWKRKFSFAYT